MRASWVHAVLAWAALLAGSMLAALLCTALLLAGGPALGATPSAAATADGGPIGSALLGDWWTPGFGARVRLVPCGDAVCGRIVWAWDEAPQERADKAALVGRQVVAGMRPEGSARWSGGRLYNPEDGRDYQGSLQLQSPTRLLLEGCALFICRQQVWRRLDADRCPPVGPAAALR